MATLTVLLDNSTINTSDGVGEIFIYLAIKNLPVAHDYLWAQRARSAWLNALQWAGTGLMELQIQELVDTDSHHGSMCNVLLHILADLDSYGATILVSDLEDIAARSLPFVSAPPVRPVREFVYSLFMGLGCMNRNQ